MSPRGAGTAAAALCGVLSVVGASCAAPRVSTTMLTSADAVRMTDAMSASLATSPAIAERGPASPPWVWTLDRVSNRTEHLLSDSEKWGIMARFRTRLSETMFAKERAVRFVLPASEWARYDAATLPADAGRLAPTHALRAEFRSDTHTRMLARSDAYLCAFQLVDLADGAIVWEDAYEVKYDQARNRFD